MCGIILLKAGQSLPDEALRNVVYNNWHSYGLVTKVGDKLDVKRVMPKNGVELTPEEVKKALDDDIEYDRILHVRHNTAGATNKDNCHPFDVFVSGDTYVVFMHNGTLHDHKSKKYDEKKKSWEDDDSGPSDSKNFADYVIQPIISGFKGEKGFGDISDNTFRRILNKFWYGSNRGILISNKTDPFFLGEWKELEIDNGEKVKVSNLDYFKELKRGPEFERRKKSADEQAKAQQKAKEMAKKNAPTTGNKGAGGTTSRFRSVEESQPSFRDEGPVQLALLKEFDFNERPSLGLLSESAVGVLNDWEMYDRTRAVNLAALTKTELEEIASDKATCIHLMEWIFSDYHELYNEFCKLEDKSIKQEKHIEKMAVELRSKKDVA